MPTQLGPISDEALSERVLTALKRGILTLQLRPGEALVERQLAQQLGVSTTPVRSALQQLAHEGLITLSPNRGAVVRRLTARDIKEIFDLREVLEPLAVRLALPRLGEAELTAARAALEHSSDALEASDFVVFAECNREFHATFIRACGNERLQAILAGLHSQTQFIGALGWKFRDSATSEHEQHVRILEAVLRRETGEAEAAARDHVTRGRTQFLLALGLLEQGEAATRGGRETGGRRERGNGRAEVS